MKSIANNLVAREVLEVQIPHGAACRLVDTELWCPYYVLFDTGHYCMFMEKYVTWKECQINGHK